VSPLTDVLHKACSSLIAHRGIDVGRQPLGAGDAASDAREGPPVGDARMHQGHFQGVCSRGNGAKMVFVLPIR
jgi:hypothetical protein